MAAFARSFVVDTSSGAIERDVLDRRLDELLKVPARVWRATLGGLLRYNDLAELGRIVAPTVLIWGDADGLVGREMQEELLSRIANATLVVYPGVGHTPRWEDPERFAADVTAFAEQLPTVQEVMRRAGGCAGGAVPLAEASRSIRSDRDDR